MLKFVFAFSFASIALLGCQEAEELVEQVKLMTVQVSNKMSDFESQAVSLRGDKSTLVLQSLVAAQKNLAKELQALVVKYKKLDEPARAKVAPSLAVLKEPLRLLMTRSADVRLAVAPWNLTATQKLIVSQNESFLIYVQTYRGLFSEVATDEIEPPFRILIVEDGQLYDARADCLGIFEYAEAFDPNCTTVASYCKSQTDIVCLQKQLLKNALKGQFACSDVTKFESGDTLKTPSRSMIRAVESCYSSEPFLKP